MISNSQILSILFYSTRVQTNLISFVLIRRIQLMKIWSPLVGFNLEALRLTLKTEGGVRSTLLYLVFEKMKNGNFTCFLIKKREVVQFALKTEGRVRSTLPLKIRNLTCPKPGHRDKTGERKEERKKEEEKREKER